MIVKQAVCPNCGCKTEFHFTGEQQWPPAVAAKLGISPLVRLWTCSLCESTISENDLKFGTGPLPPLSAPLHHDNGPLNLTH